MNKRTLYQLRGVKQIPFTHIAINPKGNRLACGTIDARILLINPKTGKLIRTLTGHQSLISSVEFTQSGTQILSSSWDNTTRLWSSTKGTQDETILSHSSEMKSLATHGESKRGAVGTRDGIVKIFTLPTLRCLRNLSAHNRDVSSVSFTPDGSMLITASWDGWVKVWDQSSYDIVKNLVRQKERIRSCIFSPRNARVYLGLHNGVIRSVSLDNARDVVNLKGHKDIISALAHNSDGSLLASGSWDKTLRVWDIASGALLLDERVGTGISSIVWHPRSNTLYSADFSGAIVEWTIDIA